MPANRLGGIPPAQRVVDETLGVLDAIANVVAPGLPRQRVHRLPVRQHVHRVGELDLAPDALTGLIQAGEDVGGEHVTPRDRQVARRLVHAWFLDQSLEADEVPVVRLGLALDDAVARDPFVRHAVHRHHARLFLFEHVEQLAQAGLTPLRRVDDGVAQEHRERLGADVMARQVHRVAQTQLALLADIVDLRLVADVAHLLDQRMLTGLVEERLEFGIEVEVVLDRALAPAGDDQDVLDAALDRFVDHELKDRRVDDRQHLLGHGLGCGEESRPHAGGGDDGLGHAPGGRGVRMAIVLGVHAGRAFSGSAPVRRPAAGVERRRRGLCTAFGQTGGGRKLTRFAA